MFETVAVESKPQPIRKGRIATLPLSVAIHALAISGAIASNVWTIDLPTNPPEQYEKFQTASPPPVLPVEKPPVKPDPPKPSEPPKGPDPVFSNPPVQSPTILTPDRTPDSIPNVEANVGGAREVPVGDPSLVQRGGGGTEFDLGEGDGSGPVQVGPGRATMPVVIKRVQPVYPKMLATINVKGSAVVECVVGRDGVIESATVVHATHVLFGEAAREAVMQWKFLPGRLGSEPVATIFQLTVTFQVQR